MELICQKCKYSWNYKGQKKPNPNYNLYVCCPRCRFNVRIKWIPKKDNESKNPSQE